MNSIITFTDSAVGCIVKLGSCYALRVTIYDELFTIPFAENHQRFVKKHFVDYPSASYEVQFGLYDTERVDDEGNSKTLHDCLFIDVLFDPEDSLSIPVRPNNADKFFLKRLVIDARKCS